MAPIVEKNHLAATYFSGHTRNDLLRRRRVPVIACDVPHDRFQCERSGNSQRSRAAAPKRRAKEAWCCTQRVFDCTCAAFEFGACFAAVHENQVGMREGVIPDLVACLRDYSCNIWPLIDEAANQEERGLHIVFGKNLEQP